MNLAIFKAYDVRGKAGTDITEEVAERLGRALATWLPKGGAVVVARDQQAVSAQLATAFISGVQQQGRDVWDIGLATTDMMYFAVGHHKLAGGVMITDSHIPGQASIFKFCHEEAKPVGVDNGFMEIRDMVARNQFVSTPSRGNVFQKQVVDDWLRHVLAFTAGAKWPKYKVAIDTGSGMAGVVMPKLQAKLPFAIVPLNFELDPTFKQHIADPLESANLAQLQATVKAEKCNLGIAFDTDGDRAVIIDEHGAVISGSVLTAILARYFLQKQPGATILYNLICSRIVPETIKQAGGVGYRTRVGYSYIKADMRAQNGLFGGEHSATFYFKDNFYTDSGLIAALVFMQALAQSRKSASQLAGEFASKYVSIPETNFGIEDKLGAIEKIRATFTDGDHDLLDGLTINFPTGWFNVRPSNTQPLLRLNAEAESKAELDKLVAKVTEVLKPFIAR